jgi:tetratricopeptide (TPR) repeat protein
MKLKQWYTFILLFICTLIYCQSNSGIDSYINKHQLKNPIYYYKFADSLNGLHQNDTGILILTKALTSSNFKNNPKELTLTYLSMGDCYKDNQEYRKGISYFNSALKTIHQLKDTLLLIRAETSITGCYSELSNLDSVMIHVTVAEKYAEKNPTKFYRYLITIYNYFALTYNAKFNFTESLNYFYKALAISEKHTTLMDYIALIII